MRACVGSPCGESLGGVAVPSNDVSVNAFVGIVLVVEVILQHIQQARHLSDQYTDGVRRSSFDNMPSCAPHTHLGEDKDAVALLVELRQHLVQQKKLARRLHHQSHSLLCGLCLGLVAFKQVRVVAALGGSSVVEEVR